MRAVCQRVTEACVRVEGRSVGQIAGGILVLLGIGPDDNESIAVAMAAKVATLRIFSDTDDKMNLSLVDTEGGCLVVSQFTLYGDTRKGRRPGYSDAARPEVAEPLVEAVVDALRAGGATVATGRFRAEMAVELVNDGPITLSIEV